MFFFYSPMHIFALECILFAIDLYLEIKINENGEKNAFCTSFALLVVFAGTGIMIILRPANDLHIANNVL